MQHGDERAAGPEIDIGTLAGLARVLETGGIYNGAKVVRALLERELLTLAMRATPATDEEAARRLAQLADGLEDGGEGRVVVTALRAAARAIADQAALPLADAPRTWTCRGCGRLFMAALPDPCPTCEAPAATAREYVPIWYLDPMRPDEALAGLEAGAEALAASIAGRDDAELARRPREGEWSAREVLQHLVAAEELLAVRVPRMLDEVDPELVATAAWVLPASDEATGASDLPASALLGRHRELRTDTLARLRPLGPDGWQRIGRHPEWGTVTVLSQAAYFTRHLWSHLAQLRAAAEGRVPGERAGTP